MLDLFFCRKKRTLNLNKQKKNMVSFTFVCPELPGEFAVGEFFFVSSEAWKPDLPKFFPLSPPPFGGEKVLDFGGVYTWNLFVPCFWASTLQKKALSNQNKGHLGSRYIKHHLIFYKPTSQVELAWYIFRKLSSLGLSGLIYRGITSPNKRMKREAASQILLSPRIFSKKSAASSN